MISAAQVQEVLALLGWMSQRLATSALVTFDEAAAAQDDVGVQCLGGLQRGLVGGALEAAGVEFVREDGSPGVRRREIEP